MNGLASRKTCDVLRQTAVQSLIFCTVGGTVKITPFILSVVLLLAGGCLGQSSNQLPAGMRHAQELEAQNETAPSVNRRSVDPITLQKQANQLADLAASMPLAVQNANKGLLEKDLVQRLKQIEKLAKQLRSQLDH
jgi:hypothetical protein